MNESSSRPCAFDGVPLQLSPEERAVLNDLAFRAGVPLPLQPWQNRHGQILEAYGLCRLTAHPVQIGDSSSRSAVPGLRASCPHIVSVAWLTARGLRAARIGEGHGPRLATLEGAAVAGWRDFRPWSYTPDAVTVQVTGDPRAGAPAPDQPA